MAKTEIKRNNIFIIVAIGILLMAIIYNFVIRPEFYRFNNGKAYFRTVSTRRFDNENTQMVIYNGQIYLCDKDGFMKYDTEGNNIWSKSFYVENPQLKASDGYFEVSDLKNKVVYVFGTNGYLYEKKESWPIVDSDINDHGFLTTVLEKDNQNIIHYYDEEGNLLIERGTTFLEDGYPIAVSTSPDVLKMVTAYLDISDNQLKTQISFFNFEDTYDEEIIGGFSYDDSIPMKVLWMNDDQVVLVTDSYIYVYNASGEPSEIGNIEAHAQINDVIVSDDKIVVWYGEAIDEEGSDQENKVFVYSTSGKASKKIEEDDTIKEIVADGDSFYIVTQSNVSKYNGKKRLWTSQTYLTINNFQGLGNNDYIAVTDYGYEILTLSAQP